MSTSEISGLVGSGWDVVADAFRENFDKHGELGAACCVYKEGRPVVDVWGGIADRRTGQPWEEGTVVPVFSTTKGVVALCVNLLAERGIVALDVPLAENWPEFAASGKEDITLRHVLTHTAGLPSLVGNLSIGDVCSWDPVVEALAAQPPAWEPGRVWAYHGQTFGFLVGESVRRTTGRTIGSILFDEIAQPMGIDAWIGLPPEQEARVAFVEESRPPQGGQVFDAIYSRHVASSGFQYSDEARLAVRELWSGTDGDDLGGAMPSLLAHNNRDVRAAELPSTNLIANARSLARLYAATVTSVDGYRLVSPETVDRMTTRSNAPPNGLIPGSEAERLANALDSPFGLGLMRPSAWMPFLGGASFGHPGAGGSFALADPEHGIGFAYVMNKMGSEYSDVRPQSLLQAAAAAVHSA